MKVLMVTIDFPPNTVGGEGIFAGKVAELLPEMGVNLTVIAPKSKNSTAYDDKINARVHRVGISGNTFLTKIPTFAYTSSRIAKSINADITFLLRPCFIKTQNRIIANFRSTRIGEAKGCKAANQYISYVLNKLYVPFDRYLAGMADRIVVFDNRMKKDILSCTNVPKNRIVELHNGIDLNLFQPILPKRYKLQKILYVGRLDIRKDLFTLIDAFKIANSKFNHLKLSIVGDGPMQSKIRRKISAENLTEAANLLGRVSLANIPEIYNCHDVAVVPSIYEPFGRVILEAMACGTPVISSDACINFGQMQFRTQNSDHLAQMLIELCHNPDRLKIFADKGIKISQDYSWGNVLKRLYSIFDSTLVSRD